MMEGEADLTARQREILAFFRGREYPPSIREIGENFGITSPNGVVCHLKALIKKGYLRQVAPHQSRSYLLARNGQSETGNPRGSEAPQYSRRVSDIVEQAPPVPMPADARCCWTTVIEKVEAGASSAVNLAPSSVAKPFIADMKDRRAMGIAKYGVPVHFKNGRNALVDAYQEVLDLIVYLQAASEQHPDSPIMVAVWDAISMGVRLKGAILKHEGNHAGRAES